MTILLTKNDQVITDQPVKFSRSYVNNFLATENQVEEYKIIYDPRAINDRSATFIFPAPVVDGRPFEVLFYNSAGQQINNTSFRFTESTEYVFTVVIPPESFAHLQDNLGPHTFPFFIDVVLNDEYVVDPPPPPAEINFITRLYYAPNKDNEVYQRIIFDNIDVTGDEGGGDPFDNPQASMHLGINIYQYFLQTQGFGPRIDAIHDYYIELQNIRNVSWNLFIDGQFVEKNGNVPGHVYGPLSSDQSFLLQGNLNNFDFDGNTTIRHFAEVNDIKSQDEYIQVDLVRERSSVPVTTTTTVAPCRESGQSCILFSEETLESTCCPGLTCDPGEFVCV